MRAFAVLAGLMLLAAPAMAAGCNGAAQVKQKFSNAAAADTFVVESFGATCADAKVLVYLMTAESGWHALHIGELGNFAGGEVTPASLAPALKEIAGRIELGQRAQLEPWAQLQKAGTQPDGAPWRGTPLARAEYERLLKQRPRTVIVPTDAARGKLIAWDGGGFMGRPVDLVYYGD